VPMRIVKDLLLFSVAVGEVRGLVSFAGASERARRPRFLERMRNYELSIFVAPEVFIF
jgi:hypothetical protein